MHSDFYPLKRRGQDRNVGVSYRLDVTFSPLLSLQDKVCLIRSILGWLSMLTGLQSVHHCHEQTCVMMLSPVRGDAGCAAEYVGVSINFYSRLGACR